MASIYLFLNSNRDKGILFLRFLLKSGVVNFIFGSNSKVSYFFLESIGRFAWWLGNRALLLIIARIYRFRLEHQKAFDIYYHYFKIFNDDASICIKAIVCEQALGGDTIYEYYLENKEGLTEEIKYLIVCDLSLLHDDLLPEWSNIKKLLSKRVNLALTNKSLLSSLAHNNLSFIYDVEKIIFSHLNEDNKEYLRRSFTIVAACYYRTGNLLKLQELDNKLSYDDLGWQLYMNFGKGDIMKSMDIRGKMIKNTFFLYQKEKTFKKPKKRVTVPEKDLCGEAFNGLFYDAMYEKLGEFSVTCDERLYRVLCSSFPRIDFIPKTPRYKIKAEPEKFDRLGYNVGKFLDNASYKATRKSNFISIKYSDCFDSRSCQQQRVSGWLKVDRELQKYWLDYLRSGISDDVKLIGFSSNSTTRSKLRDIHMIDVSSWGEVFSMPKCVFVNINAGMDDEQVDELQKKFNCKIITPKIDLFDDFDNLLALMSIFDYALLPANNLMDFAAAVGLKTIIFSPSNIMRAWVVSDEGKYVFSDKVRFVLPEYPQESPENLVKRGVSIIKSDLCLALED